MRELLLGMFIVILLAGCAQTKAYYDRPGGTPAMFERDSSGCKSRARDMNTMKPGTYPVFDQEGEFGNRHSTAEGTFEIRSDDRYYRNYEQCLKQKGWKKVPEPKQ